VDDDGAAFSAQLRACRQSARLSQQELAERSGLSVRAISNLERGRTRWPYRDSLYRLADALGLHGAARAAFIGAAAGRRAVAAARSQSREFVPRYLPAAVPAFVGRRDQLAVLSRVLNEPGGTAVITAIGGTAGVGKTALAVQWAHQVAAEFPDGQLFVNLRGYGPSDAPVPLADAIRVFLDALGVPADRQPQSVEAQLGMYRSLLAGKRMLVVLDNARDVAQVRPLLPGSPTCRVVVTSRSQLTGLAAIEAAHPLLLDVLTDAEARELLAHRLSEGRIAEDPGAVRQIISSCAHLPLALCIIAARAAMRPDLPLAHIAADLAVHPGIAAFADDDDPAADIRAAFSQSYRQLDAGIARAFRLSGLHPGPDLERYAVAALTGTTAEQAGQMLDLLARGCLIQPTGSSRYGMHDLLRGYARELAAAHQGEAEQALTRLFDYYLHAAATAMDTAFPAERHRRPRIPAPATSVPVLTSEAAARAWLDAERVSLVAASAHMVENGWPGSATRLSETLFRYLDGGGHYPEAITIHAHARDAARLMGDVVAEARALNNIGAVDLRQRRYEQAARHFRQSAARYGEAGHYQDQAHTIANLGFVEFLTGRCQEASDHLQHSLTLFRDVGEPIGQAHALATLGFIDLRQGRYQQATGHLQQSHALFSEAGDRAGAALVLGNLGEVSLRQGRYGQATARFEQALALYREMDDLSNQADLLAGLGIISLRESRYDQANGYLQEALALCRATDDLSSQASALNGLGEVLLATGHPAEARARHAAALRAAASIGEKYEQARAEDGLARAYHASTDPRPAPGHWQEALALYTELGAPEAHQVRALLAAGGDGGAR
jgi:tetratricopeptide (TPR) repeat protein/transcriptional regulator with XRE-family HTH domain